MLISGQRGFEKVCITTICGFDKLFKLEFNLMYMFGTNTTSLIQIRSHIQVFICNFYAYIFV